MTVSRFHIYWRECLATVIIIILVYLSLQAVLYHYSNDITADPQLVFAREYYAADLAAEQQSSIQCETLVEQPVGTHRNYQLLKNVDVLGGDLFPVRATDPVVLKKLCDALDDCTGFNTNGWLKRSVHKKYKSKIDLYIKTIPHTETIYLSSQTIQEKYGPGYLKMTEQMKIYVYDVETGRPMKPSRYDYKYGVESLFIQLLQSSSYLTKNAEEATFFFIPTLCTTYRKSVAKLDEGRLVVQKMVAEVLHEIQGTYPCHHTQLMAQTACLQ